MKSDKGVTIKDMSQLDLGKAFCVRFLEPEVQSDPGFRPKEMHQNHRPYQSDMHRRKSSIVTTSFKGT